MNARRSMLPPTTKFLQGHGSLWPDIYYKQTAAKPHVTSKGITFEPQNTIGYACTISCWCTILLCIIYTHT